jgi:DNA primase
MYGVSLMKLLAYNELIYQKDSEIVLTSLKKHTKKKKIFHNYQENSKSSTKIINI